MDLNIITLKWGTKFSADYVNRLYNMVQRNLNLKHRFICLTENSNGLHPQIEALPLPKNDLEYWWNKLLVFETNLHDLTGIGLFLDLDIVIKDNIDCLFTYRANEDFMGVLDWGCIESPEFNSSIMRYKIGKFGFLLDNFYTKFKSGRLGKKYEWDKYTNSYNKMVFWEGTTRYHGDQDWISSLLFPQDEIVNHIYPEKWILSYKKNFSKNNIPECKVVVFHGEPKPHQLKSEDFIKKYWK